MLIGVIWYWNLTKLEASVPQRMQSWLLYVGGAIGQRLWSPDHVVWQRHEGVKYIAFKLDFSNPDLISSSGFVPTWQFAIISESMDVLFVLRLSLSFNIWQTIYLELYANRSFSIDKVVLRHQVEITRLHVYIPVILWL